MTRHTINKIRTAASKYPRSRYRYQAGSGLCSGALGRLKKGFRHFIRGALLPFRNKSVAINRRCRAHGAAETNNIFDDCKSDNLLLLVVLLLLSWKSQAVYITFRGSCPERLESCRPSVTQRSTSHSSLNQA
jgi:hypothetical protein